MKRIFLLLTIICLCISVFAQKSVKSIRYEGVLAQVITQERYDLLLNESPSKLVATYYEATQFCYVSKHLPENVRMMGDICNYVAKDKVCDDAGAVVAAGAVNRFNYNMDRDEIRYSAYAIGNTGYYAIVYPTGIYVKNYNAFMKEYGF